LNRELDVIAAPGQLERYVSSLTKATSLGLFVFVQSTFGCICNVPPETTEVALKHYDAVFAGRVLRIKYPRTKRTRNRVVFLDRVIHVTLRVERTWKSADAEEITIVTPFSDCYYPFKVNQEYLVWAYSSGESPRRLETDLCARTDKLANATRDLNALGDGRAPRETKHNKSLDASGGSMFLNLISAAKGALIRAAASTPPLYASSYQSYELLPDFSGARHCMRTRGGEVAGQTFDSRHRF